MLTGNDERPPVLTRTGRTADDLPSMASMVGYLARDRAPRCRRQSSCHTSDPPAPAGTIPGQMAGLLDSRHDPWLLNVAPSARGATAPARAASLCRPHVPARGLSSSPLRGSSSPGADLARLGRRDALLRTVEDVRRTVDRHARTLSLDRYRGQALAILTSESTGGRSTSTARIPGPSTRYWPAPKFGRFLGAGRRLVEAGSAWSGPTSATRTWDTHQSAWPS